MHGGTSAGCRRPSLARSRRRRWVPRVRSLQRDSEPGVGRSYSGQTVRRRSATIVIAIAATKEPRPRPTSTTRAALPGRDYEAAGRRRITRTAKTVAHCAPSHSAAGQSGASPATARSALHRNSASELPPLDRPCRFRRPADRSGSRAHRGSAPDRWKGQGASCTTASPPAP